MALGLWAIEASCSLDLLLAVLALAISTKWLALEARFARLFARERWVTRRAIGWCGGRRNSH
jgi:hypothetical protein